MIRATFISKRPSIWISMGAGSEQRVCVGGVRRRGGRGFSNCRHGARSVALRPAGATSAWRAAARSPPVPPSSSYCICSTADEIQWSQKPPSRAIKSSSQQTALVPIHCSPPPPSHRRHRRSHRHLLLHHRHHHFLWITTIALAAALSASRAAAQWISIAALAAAHGPADAARQAPASHSRGRRAFACATI